MAISLAKPIKGPKPHGGGGVQFEITFYAMLQAMRNIGPYSFDGPGYNALAWAIADGVGDWIDDPTNVAMVGISTGQGGVGFIDDRMTQMFAIPAYPLMLASLETAGINGPLAASLSVVVTSAFVTSILASGGYQGVCPTVAAGKDYSKVVMANPIALAADLMQAFAKNKITGPVAIRLANGLGGGIAAIMLTAFGTGTVIGTPAPVPIPATGPSLSRVS